MALLNPVRTSVSAVLLLAAAAPSGAQTLTQDEALALVFPSAEVERRTAFLDDAQLSEASRAAGPNVSVESGVVTYYVAHGESGPLGVAYFDAHRVRTLEQVLMIVVDGEDRLRRIETVRFREPPEYRAPDGWLRQYDDSRLDDRLSLKGDIVPITGATLTAEAVTRAARRVLALHRVIQPLNEVHR
jgi:hypothetical protein